jgi:hypothetical protein
VANNRPNVYVVYTYLPPYGHGTGCRVLTKRIPRGKRFEDVRDTLPASIGTYAVVNAYSASTAREYAASSARVRCPAGFSGARRRRRRRKRR